ncbi:hypothetical protein DSO57_1001566 [Entomophthora muscae]|uniref:Uncharacterized protein n=1 Tax=Entomophthora muscae TaxID=34485 RepID=A0ACC2SAS1_9FUNG|nr:hypothetical protein DSO57_1001566 [Entomophthora muscae]
MTPEQKNTLSSNAEDFDLIEPIGFGSSATVYLSLYKPTNLKVAIKVIDMDMFERDQIDELRRETQVMSLCKHPNLLQVFCSYVLDSKLHIVMPYLAAGSCLEILKYSHSEGIEEIYIASILKQALLGLEYLHKNGHIHRDIKAGNLLVDDQGTVLLADFGVSSTLNDPGERKNVRKTFVGTPCWMAPEVMEQAGYNYKADIWSFGITALELATGHAPLAKFPPIKVLMMTLSKEPPTLDRDQAKHKYSKSFKDMIDSCLSKDPSKRPSAEKLLQHIFFKQCKKIVGITPLIKDLPPIEKRINKTKPPQQIKLPVLAESWNFTPSNEHSEKSSYFDSPSHNTATPERVRFQEELPLNSDAPVLPDFANLNLDPLKPSDEKPKKSRFVIDTNVSKSEGPSSPTGSSEIRKGRFSVSENSECSIGSPVILPQIEEVIVQLPLSREPSKSSRFSVSSEPRAASPIDNSAPNILGSFSKRGRFQVSSENKDSSLASDSDDLQPESDYSEILTMYGSQLDALAQQNAAQYHIIQELRAALSSGKVSKDQESISKPLTEHSIAIGKAEDVLADIQVNILLLFNFLLLIHPNRCPLNH